MNRLHEFIAEHRRAAVLFMKTAQKEHLPMTVVHHNDADGIAAGAILSHALSIAGLDFRLLPVEKVHEPIISKVHADSGSIIQTPSIGAKATVDSTDRSNSPLIRIRDSATTTTPSTAELWKILLMMFDCVRNEGLATAPTMKSRTTSGSRIQS